MWLTTKEGRTYQNSLPWMEQNVKKEARINQLRILVLHLLLVLCTSHQCTLIKGGTSKSRKLIINYPLFYQVSLYNAIITPFLSFLCVPNHPKIIISVFYQTYVVPHVNTVKKWDYRIPPQQNALGYAVISIFYTYTRLNIDILVSSFLLFVQSTH